jgi:two-component system cell cycle response regulator
MTARVLVVDDHLPNVRLMEAALAAEYFEVVTACSGPECIVKLAETEPDIVLLDVMMPDMDGFEVCRRIKSNPKTAHVPVVMVTALHRISDRVAGLEAGADDFLTKPVNDVALFARVRSLVRLKMMTDELRMRESTSREMGIAEPANMPLNSNSPGRVLLVNDQIASTHWFTTALEPTHEITAIDSFEEALVRVKDGNIDVIVVSVSMSGLDALRLCSQIRSLPEGRNVPILVVISEDDSCKLTKAFEVGVNDYLTAPVDRNELLARVRTQLRKKRYTDQLRHNVQLGLEMAIIDQLTGLYNRRYLSHHLDNLVEAGKKTGKPTTLVFMDIDHFKLVNDKYGHEVGDKVLREFASRIIANVRGVDLACRYGGEEFVVAMPDTDMVSASAVAERLRHSIEITPVVLGQAPHQLSITISVGVAIAEGGNDSGEALLFRADQALYRAKRSGRNRVVADAA